MSKVSTSFLEALKYSALYSVVLFLVILVISYFNIFNLPRYFGFGLVIGTFIAQFFINLFTNGKDY